MSAAQQHMSAKLDEVVDVVVEDEPAGGGSVVVCPPGAAVVEDVVVGPSEGVAVVVGPGGVAVVDVSCRRGGNAEQDLPVPPPLGGAIWLWHVGKKRYVPWIERLPLLTD